MKLYYSNYSTHSRKVRMVIASLQLAEQIEFVPIHAENNLFIEKMNPLKQVPVLVLDDETNLFGSTVICQYLTSLTQQQNIFPQDKTQYFLSLRLEALADGAIPLIDQIVEERYRPAEQRLLDLEARNWKMLYASLDWLEHHIGEFHQQVTIGEISIACFLDYLGFHFRKEVEDWTTQYPQLGQWFNTFKNNELMQSTKYHSI